MYSFNDATMRDYIRVSLYDCNKSNEDLIREYRSGISTAKEKLILKNYGLVKKLAYQFDLKTTSEVCIEDLIQEGQIGLLESIGKYDPEYDQGAKFHVYALYWIKQKMSRYMRDKSKHIRIPSHKYDEYNRLRRDQRELEHQLNRQPSIKELSIKSGKHIDEINKLRSLFTRIDSIDEPINDDDISLGDTIRDPSDPFDGIEHIAYIEWLRKELDYAFKRYLTLQESELIKARFGMDNFKPMQFNEIADLLNIEPQRAIDVSWRALNKLRDSAWFIRIKAAYKQEDSINLVMNNTYDAVDERLSRD